MSPTYDSQDRRIEVTTNGQSAFHIYNGDLEVTLFHLFAAEVFPDGQDHSTALGDFATDVNPDVLRPLFREMVYGDDELSPGVYKHCTEEFRDAWVKAGLTGLLAALWRRITAL